MEKTYKVYLRSVEILCVALLLAILSCMVIQITCRILQISQSFTEELARICFCIMVFVGSPLALAEGVHIVVDMVVKHFSPMGGRIVNIIDSIFIDAFSVFCIRGMSTMLTANKATLAVSLPWLRMNAVYLLIDISFFCLFVVSTIQLLLSVLGRPILTDIHKQEKLETEKKRNDALKKAVESELGSNT